MITLGPPYHQIFTRTTPGGFLFLLDQSLGMEEPIGGIGPRKCGLIADCLNSWRFRGQILLRGISNDMAPFTFDSVAFHHFPVQLNPCFHHTSTIKTPIGVMN